MYVLLILGLVAAVVAASLISVVLVGQALLRSRLLDTEEIPAQPATVNFHRHTQPLTA